MAELANPRHEKFCQLLVSGSSQTDAYIDAGFKPRADGSIKIEFKPTDPSMKILGQHFGMFSGESATLLPHGDTFNDTLAFVDRPPPMTREQWIVAHRPKPVRVQETPLGSAVQSSR